MPIRTINFEVAAEEKERKDENLLAAALVDKRGISLDKWMLMRSPSQGGFAKLSVMYNRSGGNLSTIAPELDKFLQNIVVDPEKVVKMKEFKGREDFVGVDWIWELVANPYIDFDASNIMDFVGRVVEEFTAFPTESSPASTSGRARTGASSTGGSRRAGSTRSRSPRAASAT